jgi:hypothetical protein
MYKSEGQTENFRVKILLFRKMDMTHTQSATTYDAYTKRHNTSYLKAIIYFSVQRN